MLLHGTAGVWQEELYLAELWYCVKKNMDNVSGRIFRMTAGSRLITKL